MDAAAKERSDMFDTMFAAEQKIRLGEPGWKARYYEVTPTCHRSGMLQPSCCYPQTAYMLQPACQLALHGQPGQQ